MIDDRDAERAAFDRIRARAHFVEQHQRRQRKVAIHRDDVRDVRGEGAQACRDRLLVADVGEERLEHRQPRPGVRRGCAVPPAPSTRAVRPSSSATVLPPVFGPVMTSTRVGGIRRMSSGPARTGFGFGIRDSWFGFSTSPDHRNAGADAVRRAARTSPSVDDHRLDAVHHLREARARLDDVELRRHVDGAAADRPAGRGKCRSARAGCAGLPPPPAPRARRCRC